MSPRRRDKLRNSREKIYWAHRVWWYPKIYQWLMLPLYDGCPNFGRREYWRDAGRGTGFP